MQLKSVNLAVVVDNTVLGNATEKPCHVIHSVDEHRLQWPNTNKTLTLKSLMMLGKKKVAYQLQWVRDP